MVFGGVHRTCGRKEKVVVGKGVEPFGVSCDLRGVEQIKCSGWGFGGHILVKGLYLLPSFGRDCAW